MNFSYFGFIWKTIRMNVSCKGLNCMRTWILKLERYIWGGSRLMLDVWGKMFQWGKLINTSADYVVVVGDKTWLTSCSRTVFPQFWVMWASCKGPSAPHVAPASSSTSNSWVLLKPPGRKKQCSPSYQRVLLPRPGDHAESLARLMPWRWCFASKSVPVSLIVSRSIIAESGFSIVQLEKYSFSYGKIAYSVENL